MITNHAFNDNRAETDVDMDVCDLSAVLCRLKEYPPERVMQSMHDMGVAQELACFLDALLPEPH